MPAPDASTPLADLRLTIEPEGDGWKVALSREGVCLAEAAGVPFDPRGFDEGYLRPLREGRLSARGQQKMGAELAQIALPAAIRDGLQRVLKDGPARLRIRVEGGTLAHLPWEFLYLDDGRGAGGFLCHHPRLHLVRDVEGGAAFAIRPEPTRRVLVAWANPDSPQYPALPAVPAEAKSVAQALKAPECRGLAVDELPYATPSALLRQLGAEPIDVFHFVGHGDVRASGGVLVLEGARPNEAEAVYADELADALLAAGVRLVMLSGCLTGASGVGIGAQLANRGVPMVVAMQFPIADTSAHLFARAFYAALAEGARVEEAVYQGRMALRGAGSDWGTPVLFASATAIPASEGFAAEEPAEPTRPRHNLPHDERPFIGREAERTDIRRKLRERGEQLVTVTGVGGMGKTRLAKQVASELVPEYRDGVWLVECDTLSGREELLASIAAALELPAEAGHSEKALADAVEGREMLLVLDCFEAQVRHAPLVDALLRRVPKTQMLVTSRIVLGLEREHEYRLAPMSLAGKRGKLADSLALFAEAAGHSKDGFKLTPKNRAAVRSLCERLEGVPLAIVLAAGRLRHQSLDEVRERLESRLLDTLRRPRRGNDRHATIQDVIDDSFVLLESESRDLLRLLGVFAGTFTVQDAAYVCALDVFDADDGLERLRDHSLVQVQNIDQRTRFKLLDTVREYLGRLEVPVEEIGLFRACRLRHAERYAEVAEQIGELMNQSRWNAGTSLLWREIGNLRAAIGYAIEQEAYALVARIADGLARTFFEAGLLNDFDVLSDAVFRASEALGDPALWARMLGLKGALASRRGDEDECRRLWLERVDLCRRLGDVAGCADALTDLAWQAYEQNDVPGARAYLLQGMRLARSASHPGLLATARAVQGRIALASGDADQARKRADQTEALLPQNPEADLSLFILQNLVLIRKGLGETEECRMALGKLLRLAADGHRAVHVGWALRELAPLYEASGQTLFAAYGLLAAVKVHAEYATRHREQAVKALGEFQKRHEGEEAVRALHERRTASWRALIDELPEMSASPSLSCRP